LNKKEGLFFSYKKVFDDIYRKFLSQNKKGQNQKKKLKNYLNCRDWRLPSSLSLV
jgi:hypothetical protein